MSTCRTCGKQIDWARSASTGSLMPLDHDSAGDPSGMLAVWQLADGLHFRTITKKNAGEPLNEGEMRSTSHYATCPQADQHRKKGN